MNSFNRSAQRAARLGNHVAVRKQQRRQKTRYNTPPTRGPLGTAVKRAVRPIHAWALKRNEWRKQEWNGHHLARSGRFVGHNPNAFSHRTQNLQTARRFRSFAVQRTVYHEARHEHRVDACLCRLDFTNVLVILETSRPACQEERMSDETNEETTDPEGSANQDVRLYVPRPEGWQARIKQTAERDYCFFKAPGQDYYHLLMPGELYLQHGHDKYCLSCALRYNMVTQNRLYWQRGGARPSSP